MVTSTTSPTCCLSKVLMLGTPPTSRHLGYNLLSETTQPVLCSREVELSAKLGPREGRILLDQRKRWESKLPRGQQEPLHSPCLPVSFPQDQSAQQGAQGHVGSNSVLGQPESKWPLGLHPSFSSLVRPQSPSEQEHALCHVEKGAIFKNFPRDWAHKEGVTLPLKYVGYAKADTELIFIPTPGNDSWRAQPLVNNFPPRTRI